MRTPRKVCPVARRIYQPEIRSCPRCGGRLQGVNSLAGQKTIQTLNGPEWIACRPGRCADPGCEGRKERWKSVEGLQRAPKHSTYGYDVIVQIGWERQNRRDTFGEIWSGLRERVEISESEVRYLYQQVYLPLLACEERQSEEAIEAVIARNGGLIVALDGLCPEGGEPHLWFLRELTTGVTLRSGWMSRQDQPAFEAFLAPLKAQGWPIRAVLSDKQRGLVPAVASLFPGIPPQFCQSHFLRNLAEPWAEADQTFKVRLRKALREEVGEWLRTATESDSTPGVLTVTGLLPSPDPDPPPPQAAPVNGARAAGFDDGLADSGTSSVSPQAAGEGLAPPSDTPRPDRRDPMVIALLRRVRYLLTLEGRPPFRLAGIELYTRMVELTELIQELLAHQTDPRLWAVLNGLERVLPAFAGPAQDLPQGAQWLAEIAEILREPPEGSVSGAQVASHLHALLAELQAIPPVSSALDRFRGPLQTVTRNYALGLFHCYDLPGLPRTNNELESHFRDTLRRLLRTTGQKGQTRRSLPRTGAWELLSPFSDPGAAQRALQQIPPVALREEQRRFRSPQARFRLHTRSPRLAARQLQSLREEWCSLPPPSTA